MAYQLIFTSYPTSLTYGRSGFSTVARSRGLDDALAALVERCGTYDSSLVSAAVYSHKIIRLGTSIWHVLSRICDSGTDYTNRNNYIAHHLVVSDAEIEKLASPAEILESWDGWRSFWEQEPCYLDDVDLSKITAKPRLPAKLWKNIFGDAGCAALLGISPCEIAAGRNDSEVLLELFAESMALFINPTDCWRVTFTTFHFPSGSSSDFLWRGLPADFISENPVVDLVSHKCAPAPAGRSAEYARTGEMNNREKYNLKVEGPHFGERRFQVVDTKSAAKNNYAVPVLIGIIAALLIAITTLVFLTFYSDADASDGSDTDCVSAKYFPSAAAKTALH